MLRKKMLTPMALLIGSLALTCAGCNLSTEQQAAWEDSGHADSTAEAFVHWDEDDPPEISTRCARCHSTQGFLDFCGADGSEAGVCDTAVPAGTGDININCEVCHDESGAHRSITSVTFPSGVTIDNLGLGAICMQCHQGRESGLSVQEDIDAAGVGDDEVSEDLGFVNIHYYAAGATLYGSVAKGGYEYAGETYTGYNAHALDLNSCVACHDPHSLAVDTEPCSACHPSGFDSAKTDISELQAQLMAAIQSYATGVAGSGIVYDATSYPYFFDEAGEGYSSWTPRLLKAAYNYQTSKKDPGAFAHNKEYIVELLQTSLDDINSAL
jgi:hypothetical protein